MSSPVARHSESNCLVRFSFLLQKKLEEAFGKIGQVVATHPWKTIIICSVICLGLCGGIQLQVSETRTEKLWIPPNSQALVEQDWVRNTFGFGGRTGYILARPKDKTDALQPAVLVELLKAHRQLMVATAFADAEVAQFPNMYNYAQDTNRTTPPSESVCSRRATLCYTTTIFDVVGSYDPAVVANMTRAFILARVNNPANYGVKLFNSVVFNVTESDIFGGVVKSNGVITGAGLIRSVYRMTSAVILVQNEFLDPSRDAWERAARKHIEKLDYGPVVDVVSFFSQTFSDEFSGAVTGDLALFGIGASLLIGYMAIALGKRDYVHSMFGIAIVAVLIVGLSVGASYGLSALFGVIVTPLTSTLPFLILGLGVDDAFIIAGEFQAVGSKQPDLNSVDRMTETMKHAGVSILITSVTDITAFFIGASTVLPALSAFCIYAAIGVLFVFVLNVTMFASALVLDAERANENRADCLCCYVIPGPKHELSPPVGEELNYCGCCNCQKIPQNATRILCGKIATYLMMWPVRIVALLIASGILAFCIVGATRLTQDFKLQWFLPDDSPLQTYYAWNDEFFVNDVPVLGYTRNVDYPSALFSAKQEAAHRLFQSAPYLNGQVVDWHSEFLRWGSRNDTPAITLTTYYDSLSIFLGGEGRRFGGFVAWVNASRPSDGLKGAFIFGAFRQAEVSNADGQVARMNQIRSDYATIMGMNEGFPFSFAFGFWEQFAVIQVEMWRNIGLAVLSVFIITTILIPKVSASFLVLVTVCLSIADLLGFMYWWGLTIDAVTVVYLVIAIGLSVDYSAHIGEAFMLSNKPTREERVIDTMYRMGASVFNGAFSTFLAVLVMAFAKTYIFRVFFQQFFLVTLFGSAHGLLILPIMLATVGPKTTLSHDEEKEESRRPSIQGISMDKLAKDGNDDKAKTNGNGNGEVAASSPSANSEVDDDADGDEVQPPEQDGNTRTI